MDIFATLNKLVIWETGITEKGLWFSVGESIAAVACSVIRSITMDGLEVRMVVKSC